MPEYRAEIRYMDGDVKHVVFMARNIRDAARKIRRKYRWHDGFTVEVVTD